MEAGLYGVSGQPAQRLVGAVSRRGKDNVTILLRVTEESNVLEMLLKQSHVSSTQQVIEYFSKTYLLYQAIHIPHA